MANELVLKVKQGEELDIPFTIKQDGNPMNLTGYNIRFQVKTVPLVRQEPIIDKLITTTSDPTDVGIITEETSGKFNIHLSVEDTSLNTGDYSLIISLEGDNYINIISSDCCNKAIYRVCEQ